MSATTSYLTYLNYSEVWVNVPCQLLTIILMSHLLYCTYFPSPWFKMKSQLSASLLVYLCTHIVMSSLSLPYHIYLLSKWHSPDLLSPPMYDPYLLFWMGFFVINYVSTSPLTVLLLTVDRCLSLKLKIYYTRNLQKLVIWICLSLILFFFTISTFIYYLELPLNLDKVVLCETFTCLVIKCRNLPQLFAKLVFCTANLLCSATFFYLLKMNVHCKVNDRVVKKTILLEFIFNVIPIYFAFIFNMIVGKSVANYTGQFPITACILDATFCSIIYSIAMLERKSGSKWQGSSQQTIHCKNTLYI